jgi:protocatechuate 3,4-dioxygenase beta subunit
MDTGNLYGTVVDQAGPAIPGVTVTLSGGAVPSVRVTDAQGDFRFLNLQPGSYGLEAEMEGFSTIEHSNIKISAGHNTEIRVTLTAGVE